MCKLCVFAIACPKFFCGPQSFWVAEAAAGVLFPVPKKFFPPSGKAQVGEEESFRFFTSIGEKRKRKYFGEIHFSALVLCESKSQRKSVEGGQAARSFGKR